MYLPGYIQNTILHSMWETFSDWFALSNLLQDSSKISHKFSYHKAKQIHGKYFVVGY